jgi:hypothetical protein
MFTQIELQEFNAEQRRRLVDASQLFESWREADRDYRHSFRGTMRWKTINGKSYLYRMNGKSGASLGPRTTATEKIKAAYDEQRARLRQRIDGFEKIMRDTARLNRAMNLGRMPTTAAKILRKLDREGLLGEHLFVVGTHSLFAYEAAAGVTFGTGLTATADIDLLWDTRRRLSLALADARKEGVLGLLRKVDHSFAPRVGGYRATNDEGYDVDLIRPLAKNEMASMPKKLGQGNDDLEAAAILGLDWLLHAPKFERVIIGADGLPLRICCIDPRAFALHKLWLSKRHDRDPIRRARDREQAQAVAFIARDYLGLSFDAGIIKKMGGC